MFVWTAQDVVAAVAVGLLLVGGSIYFLVIRLGDFIDQIRKRFKRG